MNKWWEVNFQNFELAEALTRPLLGKSVVFLKKLNDGTSKAFYLVRLLPRLDIHVGAGAVC